MLFVLLPELQRVVLRQKEHLECEAAPASHLLSHCSLQNEFVRFTPSAPGGSEEAGSLGWVVVC